MTPGFPPLPLPVAYHVILNILCLSTTKEMLTIPAVEDFNISMLCSL